MDASEVLTKSLNKYGLSHVTISIEQSEIINRLEEVIEFSLSTKVQPNSEVLSSLIWDLVVRSVGSKANIEDLRAFACHVFEKTIRYIASPFTVNKTEKQLLHQPIDLSDRNDLDKIFSDIIYNLAKEAPARMDSFDDNIIPLTNPNALNEISSCIINEMKGEHRIFKERNCL